MDRSASKKLRAFLLLSLCALLAALGSAPGQVRASAAHLQATPTPQPVPTAGPDLSAATLRLEDFPAGFEALPEDQVQSISSTAESLMRGVSRVSQATLQNLAGYRSADLQNPQFAISYLLAPLSRADQTGFDQGVANPEPVLNALAQALTSSGAPSSPPRLLDGTRGIGNTSIGFSLAMRSLGRSFRIDMVIARRAEVAEAVMVMYLDGQPPQASAVDLARLLDGRVMAIVGSGAGGGFRPAGPLVPELTTYIPTPLDISTDPAVIGANLLFAALATILFTIASEILNRTLAEHDRDLQRVLKPARGIGRAQQRIEAALRTRLGQARRVDAIKLIGIMLFYGLIFSCLDRSWNPVSLTGVWLFVTMAIAFGVVGIADDIAQWRAAKRWGLPADLTLRPSNLLLAVASTGFSRVFAVVPGIMFGTPEAFHVDKAALGEQGEARLMKISARTLLLIGAGGWLITILTALVRQSTPTDFLGVLVGGVESLLLLVFAVAAQNIFIQMLALPDTFGRALLRFNRWLWFGGLLAITFVFYHTLINPRGDLVGALSSTNVIAFLATVGAFLVFSLVIWVYFKWQARRTKRPTLEALARSETPVASVPVAPLRVEEAPAQPQVEAPIAAPVAEPRREAPPIAPSVQAAPRPTLVMPPPDQRTLKIAGATRPCPVCCGEIKAEARVCRHCKARFDIAVKAYCLNCHTVVDVNEENRCARCGGEVMDRHIVSTLIAWPPAPATQAAVASEAHAAPAVQPTPAAPRSGFPKWIRPVGGIVAVTGILVVIIALALSGAFSTAVTLPTPIPSSTVAPKPTAIPLPSSVSAVLSNARAVNQDDFDRLAPGWWSYTSNARASGGLAEITGQSAWATWLRWKRSFMEKQGVLVLFKYDAGAEFELYLDHAEWDTPDYKRWGIYAGTEFSTDVFQGSDFLGGRPLEGNLVLRPNRWYYLLLAVDEDADFVTEVWDRDAPSRQARYSRTFTQTWAGQRWSLAIGANQGKVYIDSVTAIALDETK